MPLAGDTRSSFRSANCSATWGLIPPAGQPRSYIAIMQSASTFSEETNTSLFF